MEENIQAAPNLSEIKQNRQNHLHSPNPQPPPPTPALEDEALGIVDWWLNVLLAELGQYVRQCIFNLSIDLG